MRNLPFGIHRITVEPSAELIVKTAQGHFLQSKPQSVFHRLIWGVGVEAGDPAPQQLFQIGGMRKFRRAPKTAVFGIEITHPVLPRRLQRHIAQRARLGWSRSGGLGAQRFQQHLILLA